MSWTDARIKQLKKLWQKGVSTIEIAKEFGISKNAVVGKVHRLGLKSRPSPINKEATAAAPKVKKNKTNIELHELKINSCRWLVEELGNNKFLFCGEQVVTGKPYCPKHCAIAYSSIKDLSEEVQKEKQKDKRK